MEINTITLLPKSRQPIGLALFALSATFAPAIGPTIGGYLTETWGWKYIFYVNLVPGSLMLAMLWVSLPRTPMNLGLLRQGDWAGIATLAVGLSALQTVLEEGQKDDWFGSPFIVKLSLIAASALVAFVVIELRSEHPLLNLRLLARRNFGFGVLANFILGVALYGSVFCVAGLSVAAAGFQRRADRFRAGLDRRAAVAADPVRAAPDDEVRSARADRRRLYAVRQPELPQHPSDAGLRRGSAADPQHRPRHRSGAGADAALGRGDVGARRRAGGLGLALFNMTRNLGGAFGIALLQTFLAKREQFHSNILTNSVTLFDEMTRARLARLTADFLSRGADPALAAHKAVVAVALRVRQQANLMAFGDVFFLLGAALIVALLAALLLKKPDSLAAGGAH